MEDWIYAVIFLASTSMLFGSIGGCLVDYSRNYDLHQVGIERIEECHNTKSNWYEIVWMDRGKDAAEQNGRAK